MPLSDSRLAAAMKANIIACYGQPDDEEKLECFCHAMAEAIITEITGNAVVTASGPDPQGDVQNVTGTVS